MLQITGSDMTETVFCSKQSLRYFVVLLYLCSFRKTKKKYWKCLGQMFTLLNFPFTVKLSTLCLCISLLLTSWPHLLIFEFSCFQSRCRPCIKSNTSAQSEFVNIWMSCSNKLTEFNCNWMPLLQQARLWNLFLPKYCTINCKMLLLQRRST